MIEKELQFIADFTLNKIKKLGSFFTYRKLLNTDIHPAILKYISADVDYKIYEDRKRLLQQSSFDYSGFEISKYFNLISEQIKKRTKITYDDIKKLVVEAVIFNADFTAKPNSTLKELIFSDNKKLSIEEIKMRLDYLYYHSYFAEVFNSYFKKTKPLSLSKEEFIKILKKIDENFSEKKEELITYSLNSIGDYYNVGSMDKSKIPVYLVEDFLKDKSLNDYLERLHHSFPEQSKQIHEISDYTTVLFSAEPLKPAVEKEPKTGIAEDDIFEIEEEEITPDETVTEENELEEDEPEIREKELEKKEQVKEDFQLDADEQQNLEPLYNFVEDEDLIEDKKNKEKELIEEEIKKSDEFAAEKKESAPTAGNKKNNIEDEFIIDEIQLEEDNDLPEKKESSKIFEPAEDDNFNTEKKGNKYSEKERSQEKIKTEEETEPKKVRRKDLFYYLSNRDIEKIVSSVFNDDREDFANTMEKISETETYEDATEVLKKTFSTYNVNPYAKDAVTLTNSIANYFEQN